ncbi:MAG: sugar MFS transporter [Mangrovibacterium sp.]
MNQKVYIRIIVLIGLLFFLFGYVTWVNGTLTAFFKNSFRLSNTASYLVTFAYYISYTIMAIPSGIVLKKTGFKNGMALGMILMTCGSIVFILAANVVSYPLFLGGLFVSGIGLTLLQTAVNPYITLIGSYKGAAQRISLMGFANKTGGILSQMILGSILLTGLCPVTMQEELNKIVLPYVVITLIFLAFSFYLKFTKDLPALNDEIAEESPGSGKRTIFRFPNLILGVIALFCASGVEVIAVDTIINYGFSLNFSAGEAKLFGTYVLVAMMLGYLSAMIFIPKIVSQEKYFGWCSVLGVVLSVLSIFSGEGLASVMFLAALGFVNAVFWPAIWPLALKGLGGYTKTGSALLIMSLCGGAILPLLYGYAADLADSTQKAYWLIVPLYLYLSYYAIFGHKKGTWKK